jgi:hypothetical protein
LDELSWKPNTEEQRRLVAADRRIGAERLRAEGAKALTYFKSESNIAILKALLNDSASSVEQPRSGTADRPQRVYIVREAAYNVLMRWSVEVTPKPLLRENLPRE